MKASRQNWNEYVLTCLSPNQLTRRCCHRFRRADHWLESKETEDYMAALARCNGANSRYSGYLQTESRDGGGTWLHRKLAVAFDHWLDLDFTVWCDGRMDRLIRSKENWRRARHAANDGDNELAA